MNQTIELLRRHVSCRSFTEEPVAETMVLDIVRTAQQAATDATGQMYSCLWIRSKELQRDIAAMIGDQTHVGSAPVLMLVLLDTRRLRLLLEHRAEKFGMKSAVALLFGLTDAGLFAQNLVVAAEANGLGTCYLGSVQNQGLAIAERLALPQGVVPLYGMVFGRPSAVTAPKPRIPTEFVLHVDKYRDATGPDLDRIYAEMSTATRSGDWLNPIKKYFAEGGIMAQREDDWRRLLERQGFPL